jgi:hypothetical protein
MERSGAGDEIRTRGIFCLGNKHPKTTGIKLNKFEIKQGAELQIYQLFENVNS